MEATNTTNNNAYESLDKVEGLALRISDINGTFHKATHVALWHEVGGLRVARWNQQVDIKAKLALTVASSYGELDKNSTSTSSQEVIELPDGLKLILKISFNKNKNYPCHKMANATVMLGTVADIDKYLGIVDATKCAYKDIRLMKSTSKAQEALDKATEKRSELSLANKALRK